jgi:tetratricopeptide (TPR) repeat protein
MLTKMCAKRVAGVTLALVLLAVGVRPAGGVAPPMSSSKLTAQQQKRLEKLERSMNAAAFAGKMGEALRLAREGEALRRRWQGPRHWQTVDARYAVERWQRLALLSAAAQKQAGRAERLEAEARALYGRARYAEAEKIFRETLALRQKVLGEQQPDTAQSYNNVAFCLDAQGKAARALPLHEKSLAIRKKVLGEEHPDTAQSYNNVAFCHQAQGKAAQALPLFKKALAIYKKVLGEQHPRTGTSYNNVASCLQAQGKAAQALALHEQALALRQTVLGDEHPDTAQSYNNVAGCLQAQGKAAQALLLFEKALAICKKALGEGHPDTAGSYNNVAACLHAQGKAVEALPLFEKALAIRKEVLGEEHPDTAGSYNNVAACLQGQGKAAPALPLFQRTLAISKKMLGEEHPDTGLSYNNVAVCLDAQGRAAQALPLFKKALAIYKTVLGEEHPDTAQSYNNVAGCLQAQGKAVEALPLFKKALAIREKVLGEEHPDTAAGYTAVAACLQDQGKAAQALPLCKKALAINKKVLGEEHPATATSYNGVAVCLDHHGKAPQALHMYEKALAISKKVLGEQHPETAQSYNYVALCLQAQGKYREAIRHWQAALLGHDAGRLARASFGFDRALAGADRLTPQEGLALSHARLKEPALAWQHAEAGLARNLLDDRAGAAAPEDAALHSHLRRLDERLLTLFGREKPSEDQERLRDELTRQRRDVLAQMSRQAAARSAGLVWPLPRIQEQLPADAAVVVWLGGLGENWACVLRAQGPPRWQRLTGTGAKGAWTRDDYLQPARLHQALADAGSSNARRRELIEAVRERWFTPLRPLLAAEGKLPAVRRLFVVPSGYMTALPVAVIAPAYTVSYTPSATVLAQALAGHQPLKADPVLALGDPVFQPEGPRPAPKAGVLVTQVLPGGNADRAGLRPGDVLLRFGDAELGTVNDLAQALKRAGRAQAVYWREGQERRAALAGPLGVRVDPRPGPDAVRAWRAENTSVTRGESYERLPGTRAEVLALQRLLGKGCRALLGSAASEQAIEQLASKGELKKFRIVHLATHATIDLELPERSAVILSRDRLPGVAESAQRASNGRRPYTGELTVDTILRGWDLKTSRGWKLDADVVVLSACHTGLGRHTSGEGLLGFPYALLKAGARSVVLSRWKVDDTATALFMLRFYENLLGKRKDLKQPLGKADALAEAARWLRELPHKDAEQLAAALGQGNLSGTARGSVGALKLKEGEIKLPTGGRPYAHPYYWAAFTVLGDPD